MLLCQSFIAVVGFFPTNIGYIHTSKSAMWSDFGVYVFCFCHTRTHELTHSIQAHTSIIAQTLNHVFRTHTHTPRHERAYKFSIFFVHSTVEWQKHWKWSNRYKKFQPFYSKKFIKSANLNCVDSFDFEFVWFCSAKKYPMQLLGMDLNTKTHVSFVFSTEYCDDNVVDVLNIVDMAILITRTIENTNKTSKKKKNYSL